MYVQVNPYIVSFPYFQDHVASCKLADLKCPNSGCGTYVANCDLEKHINSCPYNVTKCKWCSEEILAKEKQVCRK